MSKAPRPTLDSLAGRFARKDPPAATANVVSEPVPVSEPAAAAEPAASSARAAKVKADARVQILTRIDPGTRKRLKVIAAEQERTIQEICEEAIRDFVARHSK